MNARTHGRHNRVGHAGSHCVRKIFLKIQHSSAVNYGQIQRQLHACEAILECSSIGVGKVILAKTVQKSIFRILYRSNWIRNSAIAVGG